MNEITTQQGITYSVEGIQFSPETDRETWWNTHRQIILAKNASGRWLRQSREWASKQFGDEYVGQAEAQMELALGLVQQEKPKDTLNPGDKSKSIVTIQGVSTQFQMWYRKMDEHIEQWDRNTLNQALDLINPMEQAAKRIRDRLQSLG